MKDFCNLIASFESSGEAQEFFESFLTHSELLIFAKRFQAAKLLRRRVPYIEISRMLKLSYSTLSRLANKFRTSEFFEKKISS